MKKITFSKFFFKLLVVPCGFYLFFLYLFYPGRIPWEPFVAAAVYTFMMTVFVIIWKLSPRLVFILWLIGFLMYFLILFFAGGYVSNCLTEDFCLSENTIGRLPAIILLSAFEVIQKIVVIFLLVSGIRFGTRILQVYPPARYYTIAGLSFFFLILFRLVYVVLDHDANLLQNILSFYLMILGFIGVYIARNIDRFSERVKKIPAAAMLSSIFLLPILIPVPEEEFIEAKVPLMFFVGFAVFIFFFVLFHKKQEIGKSIEKK